MDGVTVLDESGASLKLAEMMVVLKKFSEIKINLKGYFEAPQKEKIWKVLGIYGRRGWQFFSATSYDFNFSKVRTLDPVEVISAQFCRNINPFEVIVTF